MACIQCACIKGVYDFQVSAPNCDTILYQDLSDWMEGEHYLLDKQYDLQVLRPGAKYPVVIENVPSGTSLRLDEDQLGFKIIDGIYCFTVESCGKTYIRRAGIFPNLECCFKRAKIDKPDRLMEISEIELLFQSVHRAIELQDVQLAKHTLNVVEKQLRNLKCDCDCC